MKPSAEYFRPDATGIREINSWTWQPEYKYRKVFFKECPIAGLSFHLEKNDELLKELREGTKLAVIREKGNRHDRNAVAIALEDDYDGDPGDFDFDFILGYVPRSDNAELAAMLDAGYGDKFSAEITTCHRFGNYNDRIRITIYLETKEPEIVRPDLLRGLSLSTSGLREMCSELNARGTAHFRFGGFPHHDLQYPEAGEKIVVVHRDTTSEVLFLMHVLACDEDCAPYLEDPDSIHRIDDCRSFILTNVAGPLRIKKHKFPFFEGVDLKVLDATVYLSPEVTAGFRSIFSDSLRHTLDKDLPLTSPAKQASGQSGSICTET